MKLFNKVCLIISGISAVVGISCLVSGMVLGATFDEIGNAFDDESFGLINFDRDRFEDKWEDTETASSSRHEFGIDEVKKLEIDLARTNLIFEESDSGSLYVESESENDKIEIDGYTLKVKSNEKSFKDYKEETMVIGIPYDTTFEVVDIEIGAGVVELGELASKKIEIEVGAGVFSAESLRGEEISCSVEAGMAELGSVTASKLDFDCGVGTMDIVLSGKQSDYSIEMDVGVGTLNLGEEQYSGLGKEKKLNQQVSGKKLDMECGMGSLNVEFEEN